MSSTFVPVPRPRSKEDVSCLIPMVHGGTSNPALDRWLAESVDDQPFNAIAAVEWIPNNNNNNNNNPKSSKAHSSVACSASPALSPENNESES
ncbi:hypothetical protein CDV36_009796 [Fusarium kuroshium]|uniref:Uncharacterized protein n=1 Tax=Fusarium kuroshium TaxID=2010991 RepID=A0A3M2RZ51_9HYPO|nr:hypothetical protein CDV36_009796 [Fusarium kuroshium]